MLPVILLSILWLLVALLLPLLQTLHALQTQSTERRLWLIYWMGFSIATQLPWMVEWPLQLPFKVLAYFLIDLYYEAQLAAVLFLVWPQSRGLQKASAFMTSLCGKAVERLLATQFVKDKLASMSAMISKSSTSKTAASSGGDASGVRKDRPGAYVVLVEAGVTTNITPSPDTVIAKLKVGDRIDIEEVVVQEEEQRIRARVAQPSGWISLLNMKSGKRWAAPVEEAMAGGMLQDGVFSAAAAAGCNALPLLFGGAAATNANPSQVTAEEAWEAMAMLESQLARADDHSEAENVRYASTMLRQMLKVVAIQDQSAGALDMAQAMVPEIGKIWAHQDTREYFRGLLNPSGSSGRGSSSSSSGAAASSSSSAGPAGAGLPPSGNSGSSSSGIAAGAASSTDDVLSDWNIVGADAARDAAAAASSTASGASGS